MMILRLAWLALFIVLTVGGDRLGGMLLTEVMLRSEARFSRLYRGAESNDILILGNSRGLHSFYQPEIEDKTHFTALNLSYNGLSAEVVEALFNDYLAHNERPRLIVVEVSMLADVPEVNVNAVVNFKPYALVSDELKRLLRQYSPRESQMCSVSHLFCLNSELFLRTLYYLNRADQNWVNSYQISDAMANSVAELRPQALKMFPDNLASLQQIVHKATSYGIPIRLVMAPYFPAYGDRIANLEEWLARVEAATGVSVWDYTDAIQERQRFADRVHLNKQGSKAFLDVMIQERFFDSSRDRTRAQVRTGSRFAQSEHGLIDGSALHGRGE